MVELLSEPLYILAAVQLRFRLRAAIDTAAITAKAVATVLLLRLTRLPAALALSYGQVRAPLRGSVSLGSRYQQIFRTVTSESKISND